MSAALAAEAARLFPTEKALYRAMQQGRYRQASRQLQRMGGHPALSAALAEEVARRADSLAPALRRACTEQGLPLELLRPRPPRLRLAPLEVELEPEDGHAALYIGEEELAQVAMEPTAILAERAALLQRWVWGETLQEALSHRLGEAWRSMEELLPELAALGWPRGGLALGLSLGRAAGAGLPGGRRLELAPATGAMTRQRRRVLWVEDGAGRGQWVGSLRARRQQ